MKTELYFGYGANTNSSIINERCEAPQLLGHALLQDYALVFPLWSEETWGGGVSGVIPKMGDCVEGVLYSLSLSDLGKLDVFESVHANIYRRESLEVQLNDGTAHRSWVYLPVGNPLKDYTPSRRYLETIIAGGKEHGFSRNYLAKLEALLPGSV